MTTLRRTFETPGGFLLVTVNVETGDVVAALRDHTYDPWSRPLPEIERQDDTEPGRRRHAYNLGGMHVVPVEDVACPDEAHGETTTSVMDGAAREVIRIVHCSRCERSFNVEV